METHLTLTQIGDLIPGRPCPAKLIRWHRCGVKQGAVKLRLERVGRSYFGRADWVEDFLAAQREARAGPAVESPRARDRRVAKVVAELERMGLR